jgi:hypothetical protein
MKRYSRTNEDYEKRIINGMDFLSEAIDNAILETIVFPSQWEPGFGITHRRNGEVVIGSYRNILDLGNLGESQNMTREGYKTIWEWDGLGETPASLVYTGYVTTNGRVPGRPFPDVGVSKVNVRLQFLKGFGTTP